MPIHCRNGSTVGPDLNLEEATARFPRTHFLPSLEVENMPKNGKNSPFSHSPEFTATWACPPTAETGSIVGPRPKSRGGHRQISQNALLPSLEAENMPKNGKNSPFSHSPEFTATWACPPTAE